ncbi:MAG: hypothetical protein WC566_10435 [Dehalococcoidia bacterium]
MELRSGNNGYVINGTRYIYFKHSTKRMSPWAFTFLPEHIREIADAKKEIDNVYVILACNDDGICCLSFSEFAKVIFVGETNKSKSIRVSRSPREKYSVTGTDGNIGYKIGDNDFPRKVLREP